MFRMILCEKKKSNHGYIPIIDMMKAFAILCIIVTHSDLNVYGFPHNHFAYCLVIDMAVPLFLLVSGYNFCLSNYRNNRIELRDLYKAETLKKQLSRIMLSYTILFLVACPVWIIEGGGYRL